MRPRPINLNLLSFKYPIPAIVSILHRLSGLFLIFFIPFLLWALQASLDSESGFENIKQIFTEPLLQIIFWLFFSAFIFHLLAGLRHLSMDMLLGDSLWAGRLSAIIVLLLALLGSITGGLWLWLK